MQSPTIRPSKTPEQALRQVYAIVANRFRALEKGLVNDPTNPGLRVAVREVYEMKEEIENALEDAGVSPYPNEGR